MKEPWEVYYDSFHSKGWSASLDLIPFDPQSEDGKKIFEAFRTARESLIYHLHAVPGWTEIMRKEVADRFFDASKRWLEEMKSDSEPGLDRLREMLRHDYTDWRLSRDRRR